MTLDRSHQEFVTVATDALAGWEPCVARPRTETAHGAYQVFDYPALPGATAFLFYWPHSIETTFAGYLPQESAVSGRSQTQFVVHFSRLLGQLGFEIKVHGDPADHPFVPLTGVSARDRLRAVAGVAMRNRGYLLTGLVAEPERREGADEDDDFAAAGDDDDLGDDETPAGRPRA